MTADLAYGFGITGADDVARSMQSVASQLERLTSKQRENTTATRQMAASGGQATQSFGQLVQSGQQLTTRIQGASAAVQSLVGALGSRNHTAGLVASVAGSVAQFASFGAMLGPAGAVIGGIIGATTALAAMAAQTDAARDSAARATEAFAAMGRAAISARQDRDRAFAISSGGGTLSGAGFSGDDLAAEREGRMVRQAELRADAARARAEGRGADLARIMEESRRIVGELRNLDAEIGRLESLPSGVDAPDANFTAPRRSGGGGGGRRREAEVEAARDSQLLQGTARADAIRDRSEQDIDTRREARDERTREGLQAMKDAATEAASQMEELRHTADTLTTAFGTGYVDSINAVAEAWREANRAASEAGTDMLSTGALMERSMVAVGNNIADTIGGTMVGAFEKALGAWLDGSKTFVEAAEDMVKGVLKALVIESVVQAVTETARGIADVASYQYATGAQHFAAAAAWAAVGVVAGGAGAAVGAFGGGGGGGASAPTSRELAGAQRDERGGDTYNIYLEGGFITRDEAAGAMVGALNVAARNGRRVDSRLIGG